jgi:hypothetical protein
MVEAVLNVAETLLQHGASNNRYGSHREIIELLRKAALGRR